MNLQRTGVVAAATVAVTASLVLPAWAQQPGKPAADTEPRTHRLVIENGPSRTVHYISRDLSPGEESALRDLERAENGMAFAEELQNLRRLYLRNERLLELRRGQVNPLLYGYSSEYAAGLFPGVVATAYGGFAGYPYAGGFGNVGGIFAYPGAAAALGTATNTLAFGLGNEGVIKNEMAHTLADPAASAAADAAAARAARAYDTALARVADTRLGKDFRLVREERAAGPRVTLVMKKDNEKIAGNLVSDDGEWITVETDKEEVTVRRADVDRIVRVKSDVKPAGR
jgi:hypothetical protein